MEASAATASRAEPTARSRTGLPAEDLAWLGAAATAVGMVLVLGLVAKPLSDLYPSADYPFYESWDPPKSTPEPLEAVRFLLAVAMPLLLAAAVIALGSPGRGRRRLDLAVAAVQVALVVFVALMIWRERYSTAFDYAIFDPTLLPRGNLFAAPVIGLGLAGLALAWDHDRLAPARRLAAAVGGAPAWIAAVLAVLVTALWLLPGVITDEGILDSGFIPIGHLPIEFDEFLAASNGRTPLVDYIPWYSTLLPIGLSPYWPLFDWSVTSFTVTMVLLSGVALMAVYGAFRQLTGNAWWALVLFLPFVAMTLQPWDIDGVTREFNGSYYANMPERYLGPFLVLWLCARHLRRGSPPVWVLFGLAGLAFVNNPDFGGAAVAALAAAIVFGAERGQPAWPALRRAAGEAAAGFAAALVLSCTLILVRSGELPDLDLFAYPSRLTRKGYTAAPMPLWGVHWILYVTYAAALLTAAVRMVNGSPDRVLTGLLGFAGVFGLLTAGYFATRSLPWQLWGLFGAWALALALLGLTAWLALRAADRDSVRRIGVGCLAALTSFGVMIASIDRIPPPWEQIERISAEGEARLDNDPQQLFVDARTEPGERVLILGWELDHRIAERAGIENLSPVFGTPALLSDRETGRAIDQLEEAGGTRAFVRIDRPESLLDGGIAASIHALLRDRGYVIVTRDPVSGTVEWRRSR